MNVVSSGGEPIFILNAGQDIASTNYWDHDIARKGGFFLSGNAGALRLLVPDSRLSEIPEMLTAQEVVVSRGPWPAIGGQVGIEVMFDDHTDSPYCAHLSPPQTDRTASGHSGEQTAFPFTIWTRTGMVARLEGYDREVKFIPWCRPLASPRKRIP